MAERSQIQSFDISRGDHSLIVEDFFQNIDKKHKAPNERLIKHKNSALEHK